MEQFDSLKDLARHSRYATYATVNEDGSPHNSPMFYIPSERFDKLYMGTHPESLHAKNMVRTGQAFAVIFGRTPHGSTGVYFKIENFHEVSEAELPEALAAHNAARALLGKDALPLEYYQSPNPQRMYVGDIVEISTNDAERGSDGRLAKDVRFVIPASDLQ